MKCSQEIQDFCKYDIPETQSMVVQLHQNFLISEFHFKSVDSRSLRMSPGNSLT